MPESLLQTNNAEKELMLQKGLSELAQKLMKMLREDKTDKSEQKKVLPISSQNYTKLANPYIMQPSK